MVWQKFRFSSSQTQLLSIKQLFFIGKLNDSTEKQIAEISIAFLIKSDLNKLIHFIWTLDNV
jgi:hypothetical protein